MLFDALDEPIGEAAPLISIDNEDIRQISKSREISDDPRKELAAMRLFAGRACVVHKYLLRRVDLP